MIWTIMPFIDCWDFTRHAIHAVLQQTTETRLLLIDNGSVEQGTLNGVNLVVQQYPNKVWLWRHAPQFPSLAMTWNHALDFVFWHKDAKLAWVVNNDIDLKPTTLSNLRVPFNDSKSPPLFVSGVGVNEADFKAYKGISFSRGGPDFSCFLISREGFARYRFDENFVPAYHEDNDYHRRMILGGDGERIYSVNVPFLHFGSKTIQRSEAVRARWNEQFEHSRAYYVRKWGGLPGEETFETPFGEESGE